jgi:alpha-L-rhamnosidase
VQWRVRTTSDLGESEWSDWASFEAGLFDEDWSARWITPAEGEDPGYGRRPAHVMATTVELPVGVVSARLYATALGVYEAFVNGERAGTAQLAPGATSYDRTLYAQASDVTASIRPGANTLEIVLSDGWFRGQVGAFRAPAGWGTVLGARAELHAVLADGSSRTVITDGDWTSRRSEIVQADLMAGQTTDFSQEAAAAASVLVDAVHQPPAVSWSPAPPVRVIDTRPVESLTEIGEGVWVADFGQNASGWIRLADLGPAGTRTIIDYGEFVGPDGDLSTSHLDSVRAGESPIPFVQRDEVVSGGGDEVFEPRHTVHGFQYARVRRAGATLDAASLQMRVVHTDLRQTGTFSSSSDDLNRLHELARWSWLGNAVDIPTDCPTRERIGWTGDYQIFVSTATRLYDVLGFSRKWLQSVRDDQLDDGRIANFSPDGRRIKHNLQDQLAMMTGSAGWGDAIVAVPWELYLAYGDRDVLAENWDAMARWVDWTLETARTARHHSRVQRSPQEQPHEQYLWDGSFHWGEWTEPKARAADGSRIDPIQDNPMAWFMADKGEVGTAYLYRSTSTLAQIAQLLGKSAEADMYAAAAERVRDAWRTEFLLPGGRTVADTQAAYVRALSFGLIPDDQRAAAASRLVELIRGAGLHLGTGFLSTGDLLPVLADLGHPDIAYALLLQRTSPSWLAMVDRGATTIWEDWDGIDEHGVAHDSLNHYSKGAVVRFLHTHVLGLRQAEGSVAWSDVVVEPVPGPEVTWARGTHDSPQGAITVQWRLEGDEIQVSVDAPASVGVRIVLPDGTETEARGSHRARGLHQQREDTR